MVTMTVVHDGDGHDIHGNDDSGGDGDSDKLMMTVVVVPTTDLPSFPQLP